MDRINHRAIISAARKVCAGGVIAYPTEFVFGLGCDPAQRQAVSRILRLKRRAQHKGFIIIASSVSQLRDWVSLPDNVMGECILATWPGPVTWVLPRRSGVPDWLTGGRSTLAVRVTAHPVAARLCDLTGPLLSTSANRSGFPAARSSAAVRRLFHQRLDSYLPGAVQFHGAGSTIRDGRTGRILRP